MAPFIWQNGGKISNEGSLTLTDLLEVEAVQWFVDWQVKEHIVPDAVAEKAESSESRFLNGRTAMYFNSRRVVPTLREITAFDWDVAPLPAGQGEYTILHSDAYCLAAASKHKDAAWSFIEFANSADGQKIIAKTGRTVPSLVQVAECEAFLEPAAKPEHSRVFVVSFHIFCACLSKPIGWILKRFVMRSYNARFMAMSLWMRLCNRLLIARCPCLQKLSNHL